MAITAPTASAVMIPSPMPIRAWTPIIAPPTEPTDTASLPPMAYSTDERERQRATGDDEAGQPRGGGRPTAGVLPSSRRSTRKMP